MARVAHRSHFGARGGCAHRRSGGGQKVSGSLMSEVTQMIDRARQGDQKAAEDLLPLVYDELRRLAAHKMAQIPPGQTLQPTALVHEAYLRLTGDAASQKWDGRGHFFAAAAEAMRRILIESARRKHAVRHGGGQQRVDIDE